MASAFGSDSVSGSEKDPKLEDEEKKGSDNEEMKESENEEKKEGKRKLEDEEKKGSDDEEMKGSENEEKKKGKRKLEDEEKKGSDNEEMKGCENEEKKKGKRMSEDDWEREKTAWEESRVEDSLREQDERMAEAEEEKELERQKRERTLRRNERTIKLFKAATLTREWEDAVNTMRERAQKEKEEWAGKEWRIQELKKAFHSGDPLITAEHLADIRDWQKKQKEFLRSEEEQEMDIMLNACSAIGAKYIGYDNDIANIYISSDDD